MDRQRRIGLAFWLQRPRHWTLERRVRIAVGRELLALLPPDDRLEGRWRRQRFRSRKPSPWEQWILEEEARRRGRRTAGEKPDEANARPAHVPPRLLPPVAQSVASD